MRVSPQLLVVTVAVLVLAAWMADWLVSRGPAIAQQPRGFPEQLVVSAGHGGGLAMLGGLRPAMASACWLQANLAWERRDLAGTVEMIELTVATDERPLYFWLNGARILACDMPEWRTTPLMPAALRGQIAEEQAQHALEFLEKGLRWRGPAADLYIEMANIHLRRRADVAQAARFYRLAAEQPDAPYFAGRIYAELLCSLGRPSEALAWLKHQLPDLPRNDPGARRDVVLERIKALERTTAAP